MLQETICLHGQDAAALFYDNSRFKRKGAVPNRIKNTLFGKKTVQTMDGEAHLHRKQAFMSLMTHTNIAQLMQEMAQQWRQYAARWEQQTSIVLFDEVQKLICQASCRWAGVPLPEEEVAKRAYDFITMVDAFGAVGPRHLRGRLARQRGNSWMKGIIKKIRSGEINPPEGTAAHLFAWHRDAHGNLLSDKVAAVELINVIRPTVAITYYITFAALALHQFPACRQKLKQGDEQYAKWFAQEVRRFYPFAPFIGARVRQNFSWQDYQFKKGTLTLLDLYGTNHDPQIWHQPEAFRPERFRDWNGSPFNFIPQGGGDYMGGHRCAGEWITIETVKLALQYLTNHLRYELPPQNLHISLTRLPARPKSGLLMHNISRQKEHDPQKLKPKVTAV